MQVVLDSNVYVSAALSVEGNSRSILKLAEQGLFNVLIADSITDEVERVLKQKLSSQGNRMKDSNWNDTP